MTSSRYLRYPHLRGDLLTFIADNDVWLAPVTGGRAWRISADQASAAYPRLSPDGSLIAWTSLGDGPAEIFLADTGEGRSVRVTYWSHGSTKLRGWGPDGEILATSSAGQPFRFRTWAYAIPVSDGTARFAEQRRLPYGPVAGLAIGDSAIALLNGTDSEEPAFWKRYRGGQSGRLWVAERSADGGQGEFRRILADVAGQLSAPMLVGGRLAFISDHEGIGNVYSCALDGSGLRRHTDHAEFYARNASTDGTRVIYQHAGDLWLLTDLSPASEPVLLEVSLGSPPSGRAPQLVSGDDQLDDFSADETGRASVVEVQGTVHWLTHRDGPARALSVIPGPVASLPRVVGDTGQAIWVVDADGADALEIAATDGGDELPGPPPRRIARGEIGWAVDLAVAPDGTVAATAAMDGGLHLVTIESGQVTELARSEDGRVTGLAFSPDSRWLAWSEPVEGSLRKLRLARLSDRQVTDVTDGRFTDTDPAFSTDGKYLGFLSKRSFDPVPDSHVLDLSFPFGCKPYLLMLDSGTSSPFGPFADGRPAGSAKDDDKPDKAKRGAAKDEQAKDDDKQADSASGTEESSDSDSGSDSDDSDEPAEVTIDLEGLGARIVSLPVPESRYSQLRPVDGGFAWLRQPISGDLGEGGASLDDDSPRAALEYFDLKRAKCTELVDEADEFVVSGDGTRLVVRDHHHVFVVPATRKTDSDSTDDRVSVDLSRARFRADPAALWRAAFAQAGQIMRHEFWVPDLAGVDWDEVLDQYRPLADRVATPHEFADVLNEMVAELGSSHAYIAPADGYGFRGHSVGLLGADLTPSPEGWRITRVLPAESSDPRARSPLTAPGAGLAAGDLIAVVDGQPVDPAVGPGPLLTGTAGKPVELTVVRATDGKPRRAVVVPLADEQRLRYQDWVNECRRRVRELGQGRIGYLHVSDMQSRGWSDFTRDLRGEMRCEALVVDVRGNRGGHISQLVVEKLSRRIIGWDVVRNAKAGSYPEEAPRGPVIAIADEHSCSDGDIITGAIKIMKIGPVVGTRTWGGVIGIAGFHRLIDGTRMTAPKFSFWFSEFGWDVENYGVEPDIEVHISPDDWAADRDPQLEAAVTLALERLETQPAVVPPSTDNRPDRRRPQLPPRPA